MFLLSILVQQWRPWHGDHMTGGGWGMILLWILIFAVLILAAFAILRRQPPR